MSDFPVIDSPRTASNAELGRAVIDYLGMTSPYIEETDFWCSMPVRLIHDQGGGFQIELGPYTLDADDLILLSKAIVAWRQATGVTA